MKYSKIYLLILISVFLSCVKYSFKGALPSYLQTIYIGEFQNQTQYPQVMEKLNQKTTEAFIKDNSLRVIDDRNSADLVLEGVVVSIQKKPVSITIGGDTQRLRENVQEFHMVVTVKAECMNKHTQKPLWSSSLSRYGVISGNALGDEIDLAIDDAIDQLVEDILTKTIAAW